MLLYKMELATGSQQKISAKFQCSLCNYKCNKNSEWQKHILTAKHIKRDAEHTLLTKQLQKKICC
jgi:hypothetical protein